MAVRRVEDWTDELIAELVELYRATWWTAGRTPADVRRMLEGSDVVIGFQAEADERLIAFARALSDGVYKALVFDVIVTEAWQGTGLGRRLIDAVLAHPRVASVRHVELYCRAEMLPFYDRWDFADTRDEMHLLRRQQNP